MDPENVAPAPMLFLPHYCSTIFRNRDTCKCGSVSQWCAIEQHCSQSCFPHPFVGVTTEGTFKAAIITKRTFMVLLLRALTNTSFMWICLPECLSGEAWPEKASKGEGPPRSRGQHEQSWQCLPACHVPVRCMHLAVVGKAAGEGGRAMITERLVCRLRSLTAPSDCSLIHLTNSKGAPTMCKAWSKALGIPWQKWNRMRIFIPLFPLRLVGAWSK